MKKPTSFWRKSLAQMPRTVWALGLVSLLMDVSSELVHGLLPGFLVSVLAASYTTVGLIEGFGEATAVALKVFSGPLSDWWGKRKPLVFIGYLMGAVSKPFFALATTPAMVLGARIFDRTGKGIRGAPRDALIADVVSSEMRGQAFGLRQSLDTVGAFLGPLLAIFLMSLFHQNFRTIFWIAAVPGFLCVLVLVFGVQESESKVLVAEKKLHFGLLRELNLSFWLVSIVGGIFQLARFSEAFLLLRAQNLGLSLGLTPLVLVGMNIVYALSAYPIGWLSDRWRREWLVITGFLILIVANIFLALANNLVFVFAGVVFWGLHLGFTQGILAALVADTCSSSFRGTAYGIFNLFSAVALFIASTLAGALWDQFGPALTFGVSAGLSIFGVLILFSLRRLWSSKS